MAPVGQCFEHLLTANRLMLQAADDALTGRVPRTVWQRLPVVPGVIGRMLIRSQAPGAERKFRAPSRAQPASTDVGTDIIQRFVEQHQSAVTRLRGLDERRVAHVVMTSPFVRVIAYSVLDGWRLVFAHDRRHFQQAHRITLLQDFPGR